MSMELKQLFDCAIGRNIPTEFENQNIDYEAALRDEVKKLVFDARSFRRNGREIFDLMEESVDQVLPVKVQEVLGAFSEVLQFGNNDAIKFKRRLGHNRGKQYVTRSTAAGVYDTFRLDEEAFELRPYVYGGGAIVDFERYLDGVEDIMEVYDILMEGLMDRIYEEVQGCLLASYNDAGRPARNKVAVNGFDAVEMASLLNVVSAYGTPVIYCSAPFASSITNIISNGDNVKMSDEDIADFRRQGYIGKFAGAPVIVLPNSFIDEENEKAVFDPRYAFVIPAGKEKIVKIAMVGQTIIKQVENEDWSMEIQMYKKLAVGVVSRPNYWGIYFNSAIDSMGWA